jgi:hypothetical protein
MNPEDTQHDRLIGALIGALVAFSGAAGVLALVGAVLALIEYAAQVATVAGISVGITIALRKGTK